MDGDKANKGQWILECLFDAIYIFQKTKKNWQISAQESEKWSNHKTKALYNVSNTLNSSYNPERTDLYGQY